MAINITTAKKIENGFYINGKGVLLDNWEFHKKGSRFTNEEIQSFDSYIKSLKQ